MTATDQQQLGKTFWAIADDLRGAMNADDLRDGLRCKKLNGGLNQL
jgi:hypothetical protein